MGETVQRIGLKVKKDLKQTRVPLVRTESFPTGVSKKTDSSDVRDQLN